jgi:hypothetical protein
MKRATVELAEKLIGQLKSLHEEMSALTKKSPNDAVNTFKIGLINSTLEKCNTTLGKTYRPFEEFQKFDPDNLPSNSDATLILSQYIRAFEQFRANNIYQGDDYAWYWQVDDKGEPIRTLRPDKFNED